MQNSKSYTETSPGDIEIFLSYLGPWRVELCICEDMNAGGNLSDKAVAVICLSVGDVRHGFGGNVSNY